MNVRLMGPEDVVRAWARRFEQVGVRGDFYPMRRGEGLRWYATIDDRVAAAVAEGAAAPASVFEPAALPKRPRRKGGGQ
jgi:hypothetical protein